VTAQIPDRALALQAVIHAHCGPLVERGAEIGVQRGETSAHLLRAFPRLHLVLIDRWNIQPYRADRNRFHSMAGMGNAIFDAWEADTRRNVAFAGQRARILKLDFRVAVDQIDYGLDFCFLDAAHSYQDTMQQILLYAPLVRPGGIVAGHDYGYPQPGFEGVANAVDDLAAFLDRTLFIDRATYLWYWIQP
jgi:predicted O-methyltransferase YrrM